MGKVKTFNCELRTNDIIDVSIPYGKGKGITQESMTYSKFVSIPYGKGKEVECAQSANTVKCINSLWERLRCCPRAKRLGNSTHATALREDEPQAKTDRQSATAKADKSKRAYE